MFEMFENLTEADVEEIDKLLWLSSPAFKRNPAKHEMLYAEAVRIGKETAIKYPVKIGDTAFSLEEFGVSGVEFFNRDRGDRAYYMPDERKIYINQSFVSEMADYFKSLGNAYFTADIIMKGLLLHELYHHIEENLTQPTDSLLKNMHNVVVPPVYRDIAAFAFVNALIPKMTCQLIDVFWLRKHCFEKFEVIERKISDVN